MQIFIHRINTIEGLKNIPSKYGVEVDIRGQGNRMLLSHDTIDDSLTYTELEEYLKNFAHAGIIFNMKEAGYEAQAAALAEKYGIENYFLLDVEFPYLYRATRSEGVRKIAVRYSEAEPIEAVIAQTKAGKPLLDWVWIDTNTILPLDAKTVELLSPFKTCLVSPCRWGRPEDIPLYAEQIKKLNFPLTGVMTELKHAELWESTNI